MAQAPGGAYPHNIDLECAQVPHAFEPGSLVWLWLGSDNNKGQKTDWAQGIRALAKCEEKVKLDGGTYRIILGEVFLLPRTVEKRELLQVSPETYTRALSDAAVIGLNNYASQVVQLLEPNEFATIGAMIARLLPEIRDELFARVPAAANIDLLPRLDHVYGVAGEGEAGDASSLIANSEPEIGEDDPILQAVIQLAIDDDMGGVMLLGAPGTGKSWYARQVAKRLTGNDPAKIREVQFHPSYQYEDFVEGYVPDGKEGFRLANKHLLEIIEVAKTSSGPVVMIIDEFSRTDPARVMGETMTYMEGSLRGVPFYLPSGRKISIPTNLLFLATMNPEDRSVDEIDAAMDRRWGKITIDPDVNKVRDFLEDNDAPAVMRGPTLKFFTDLQHHLALGHAFFRKVKDLKSLERLWDTQLKYAARKRFRLDTDTLREVEGLWIACKEAIEAALSPAAVEPPAEGGANAEA